MRKGLQRILALGLVLLLAAAAALGEEAAGLLPALELPEAADGEFAILTESEDPQIGPHEEGYLFEPGEKSPWGYADPSITVRLGTGRVHNTNYMYARVKIADPMQLRTMMANDSLKRNSTVMAHLLARRVQAVVAINGVLEADDMIAGPVVRQGVTLRPAENASASQSRALCFAIRKYSSSTKLPPQWIRKPSVRFSQHLSALSRGERLS